MSVKSQAHPRNRLVLVTHHLRATKTARHKGDIISHCVEGQFPARQAEYHKNLMVEMDLAPVDLCVSMFTDSQGAVALVANPVQRQRTKHISVPYHYVQQLVEEKVTAFGRVASKDNAADLLTKAAGRRFHSFACFKMGLTGDDSLAFVGR